MKWAMAGGVGLEAFEAGDRAVLLPGVKMSKHPEGLDGC